MQFPVTACKRRVHTNIIYIKPQYRPAPLHIHRCTEYLCIALWIFKVHIKLAKQKYLCIFLIESVLTLLTLTYHFIIYWHYWQFGNGMSRHSVSFHIDLRIRLQQSCKKARVLKSLSTKYNLTCVFGVNG